MDEGVKTRIEHTRAASNTEMVPPTLTFRHNSGFFSPVAESSAAK